MDIAKRTHDLHKLHKETEDFIVGLVPAWKTGGFRFPPKLLLKTKSQQRNQELNSDEASSSLHW